MSPRPCRALMGYDRRRSARVGAMVATLERDPDTLAPMASHRGARGECVPSRGTCTCAQAPTRPRRGRGRDRAVVAHRRPEADRRRSARVGAMVATLERGECVPSRGACTLHTQAVATAQRGAT